jgi:hypothetical protein
LFSAGTAVAVPIQNDPNYNLSFEWHWPDAFGVVSQIYGHTGIDATAPTPDPCDPNKGVFNWFSTGSGFQGVDVFCPEALDSPTHCHNWPASDGIGYIYLQHSGNGIRQILDGNDPNAVITAGRKYTMTIDAMDFGTTGAGAVLYSASADPIVSKTWILPEVFQPIENCDEGVGELDPGSECSDWHYDLEMSFIAADPLAAYIGETLSIRLIANGGGGSYVFMDNVRLEWIWATDAFDPVPGDEGEDVAKDASLVWTPGLWAASHVVYFHEDFNKVDTLNQDANQGRQDPNTWSVLNYDGNELDIGKTYYWRIVEVNEGFVGGGGIPSPPWVGAIWSFIATGYATNPNPEHEAIDVPFLGTVLSWSPGTDSNSHDVYFGTDVNNVTDANTSVTLGVFIDNREANSYDQGALLLGVQYYWRIDAVNEITGTLLKGKVWSFTAAAHILVEGFDSYPNTDPALLAVWKHYTTNFTSAQISLRTVAEDAEDGNSLEYFYQNSASPYYSEAYADMTDLGVDSNWTLGGVEALRLGFKGTFGNAIEDMYVAITDGSARTGKVLYDGDPNNALRRDWTGFYDWNIRLTDFVDDNSVDLGDVQRLTIGFGDKSAGGDGTVYFDNIRLYPPRCIPQMAPSLGYFRYIDRYTAEGSFVPDCMVDNFDLRTIAWDWLISGLGSVTATTASDTNLMGQWAMDDSVMGGGSKSDVVDSSVNGNDGLLYDDVKFDAPALGATGNHHTTDRVEGTGALEFDGIDDFIKIPVLNLNSNTVTVSAWVKPVDLLGAGGSYPPIVSSNEPNGFKLCFGSTATYKSGYEWEANNELAYFWTGWSWDFHSELIMPPNLWSFVALVVEPTKGTLYLYNGIEMSASVNREEHVAHAFDDVVFIAGYGLEGIIDDVRIYNRSLSSEEILDLAGLAGTHNLGLEPWRPDSDDDDTINLKDYAATADNWLEEVLWP